MLFIRNVALSFLLMHRKDRNNYFILFAFQQRMYLFLPPEVRFSPREVTFTVSGLLQRGHFDQHDCITSCALVCKMSQN